MERLEDIEDMAKTASQNGLVLRLDRLPNGGYVYTWSKDGINLVLGKTSADTKPVAFVEALKALYGTP